MMWFRQKFHKKGVGGGGGTPCPIFSSKRLRPCPMLLDLPFAWEQQKNAIDIYE